MTMRNIIAALACMVCGTTLMAQSFWTATDETAIALKNHQEREVVPDAYGVFTLDFEGLRDYLNAAPEEQKRGQSEPYVLSLPMPDGSLHAFAVYHSSVMMPGLQKRYPNIRSFKGYSLTEPSLNTRFDYHGTSFHASMRTPNGTIYIDPYATNQSEHYITYYTRDHHVEQSIHTSCGFDPNLHEPVESKNDPQGAHTPSYYKNNEGGEPTAFRTYRLALACTGEWGNRYGGTVEAALGNMNTSVNRLNEIFENDLSIRLLLVDRNDEIIFLDGDTDPYDDPNDKGGLLNANTNRINNAIGLNSYDIGHIYSTSCGGGVAFRESVCKSGSKGAGVTCFDGSSVISATVRVASHEIGHQFGASHSWNGCQAAPDGNRSPGTAYEPGSGSTIMSYAGICGQNNVQSSNDDYFHVVSLQQIFNYMRLAEGNSCAAETDIGNTSPSIDIPLEDGFYIPLDTPFELTGTAEDAEGNEMSFAWEQFDRGPESNLGTELPTGPLFRARYPTDDRRRIFPRLSRILTNTSDEEEILPTMERDLTFRFIARDNNADGGAVSWDEVEFKTAPETGPFEVTAMNSFEILTIGQDLEVTWSVANTDLAPIDCQYVNICLSIDGGANFDHVLGKCVPNTGSYTTRVPNLPTGQARIKIKAVDNIFFDINNSNFRISDPETAGFYFEARTENDQLKNCLPNALCLPDAAEIDITTIGFEGFTEAIHFDVISDLPDNLSVSFSANDISPGESTTLTIMAGMGIANGPIEIEIEGSTSSGTRVVQRVLFEVISNDFSAIEALTPSPGASGVGSLPVFTWTSATDAQTYTLEVATTPTFGESIVLNATGLTGTEFTSTEILEKNTLYYWRIRGTNACGSDEAARIFAFHTEALSCTEYQADNLPINITASGTPTIEIDIDVFDEGQVRDVNIDKFQGPHDRVNDLKVSLISPEGIAVVLMNRECGTNLTNFNIGFDDEAPSSIQCPLSGGTVYRPNEPLSTFNDVDAKGEWILRVEDAVPGAGGAIDDFRMELCSNVSVDNPTLINNNRIEIPPGSTEIIQDLNLLVTDPNNTADELIYTLVDIPANGMLLLDGVLTAIGDQFSQADIDDLKLRYIHDDSDTSEDHFLFTVVDGEGGWIDVTQFDVAIDPDFTSSVDDLEDRSDVVHVFPNPASERISIQFIETLGERAVIDVVDINGRLHRKYDTTASGTFALHAGDLSDGVYFVKIRTSEFAAIKKIVVQH